MRDGDEPADCLGWPEVSGVEFEDPSELVNLTKFHAFSYGGDPTVVCLAEGAEIALSLLVEPAVRDVCLVSVRPRKGEWIDWWPRLVEACSAMGVEAVVHGRGQIASALAARSYEAAVKHLKDAAELLMGDAVQAGPDAMRLERACNRALDVLCSGAGITRRGR